MRCALRLESGAQCRSDIGKWCVVAEHDGEGWKRVSPDSG